MSVTARLLALSRLAKSAPSAPLTLRAETSRHAWAGLPALSALVHSSLLYSRTSSFSTAASTALFPGQEQQAWPKSAALPLIPAAVAAAQHRAFATRPPRSPNRRAQAALGRQKRAQQQQRQQAQAAPVVHDASQPAASGDASPRTEVVPSEAPPTSVEIANVVDHPALIITRNIEWGTVILGFEQCNKYTILNEKGETVALLAEEGGGVGTAVGRQLLRRRRPFTATFFSPDGSQIICRVKRPFYLINSSIMIEDGTGAVVGEVHQRWHLWRRKYDLYLGKRQFATIDGGFLAWEFVLRDQTGGVLALIDRNFQGFGKELFTDAGKYIVHFGESPAAAAEHTANTIAAAHPDKPRPPVTPLAKARNALAVIPTQTGDQLDVVRGLGITERSAVLAAAVSIDFDYFSQHSQGSGMMPFFMPMPVPSYPAEDAGEAGGAAEGAGGSEEGSSGRGPEHGTAAETGVGAGAGSAVGAEAGAEAGGGGGLFGGSSDGSEDVSGGSAGSEEVSGGGWGGGSPAEDGAADLGGDEWGGEESGWGDDLSEAAGDEGGSLFSTLWDAVTDSSS